MEHTQAAAIAVAICERLAPHCKQGRINIAGSIRRKKPEVKDIEIICVPEYMQHVEHDLFGETVVQERDAGFTSAALGLGMVITGQPTGRYIKIELPQGISLDLFMPFEPDYFRQLAIRTGSAEYAARVIAAGWRRAGWVGTEAGLRREEDCRRIADNKWEVVSDNPTIPPVWASEEAFFRFIGVEWVAPHKRI